MAFNGTNSYRIIGLCCLVFLYGASGIEFTDSAEEMEDAMSSIKNQPILYDGETVARVPFFKSYPQQSTQVFHYAAYQSKAGTYNGVQALLDVYGLDVLSTINKVSTSQIWIENGQYENLNSIQVGWRVYNGSPNQLFISWTSKGFKNGCDDLNCPGFILDDDAMVRPTDILSFPVVHLKISKDMKTGDWWLYVNHLPVGHWPRKLLPKLGTSGTVITIGGMVGFPKYQLSPPMGSGHNFSDPKAPKAQIRTIKFINATGGDQYPSPSDFTVVPDDHKCYQVSPIADSPKQDGYYFNFGGYGQCKI